MSMEIKENHPLKSLTTFKIGGSARYFVEAESIEQLKEAVLFAKQSDLPILVLSGGSNMLLSDNGFEGLVIRQNKTGLKILSEDDQSVRLYIEAAEVWDDVVSFAVGKGWGGIENLSHIPGKAGSAVVQNIGAY